MVYSIINKLNWTEIVLVQSMKTLFDRHKPWLCLWRKHQRHSFYVSEHQIQTWSCCSSQWEWQTAMADAMLGICSLLAYSQWSCSCSFYAGGFFGQQLAFQSVVYQIWKLVKALLKLSKQRSQCNQGQYFKRLFIYFTFCFRFTLDWFSVCREMTLMKHPKASRQNKHLHLSSHGRAQKLAEECSWVFIVYKTGGWITCQGLSPFLPTSPPTVQGSSPFICWLYSDLLINSWPQVEGPTQKTHDSCWVHAQFWTVS